MKKIISLISALAISATAFAAMTVTSFAAPAADSKPVIKAYVDSIDEYGYATIYIDLENNEELHYSISNTKKITSNAINAIQVKLSVNPEVFDLTETYMNTCLDAAIASGGEGSADVSWIFGPTTIATYMTEVPEHLGYIYAYVNEGYTLETIPEDAVTFGPTKVEYTSYANVKESVGATTYTIYGANLEAGYAFDYKMETTFTNGYAEGGEGGEDDDTATAMADGVTVTKGVYAGMTSASTDVVATSDLAKIVITNDVDTSKTLTWEAPKTYGEGKQNVLAVLLYDAADDTLAGSTFAVNFLNAAGDVIKAFTYLVD